MAKFCTECGTKVSAEEQKFCVGCGAEVSSQQQQEQSEPAAAELVGSATPPTDAPSKRTTKKPSLTTVGEPDDWVENPLAAAKEKSVALLVLSFLGAFIMGTLVLPIVLWLESETWTTFAFVVTGFLVFQFFFQWWKFHHYRVADLQTRALIKALRK